MKKWVILFIFTVLLFPTFVNAEKITTKVIGINKVTPGETVVYTVIVDKLLTDYSAEVTYDRDTLNLVDVEEINIDTTTKDFSYQKLDPIVITSKSKTEANIIYTLTFSVKNFHKKDFSEIAIKTKTANNGSEEYSFTDVYNKVNIVEEDKLFIDDETNEEDSDIKKIINSVNNFIKKNDNKVLYISLSLNFILLILLIISLKRKKVDYDF